MIELTDFDLHKLYGYIYSICDKYDESLMEFNEALKIQEDGQIFFQMAYCFAYLREYKTAQEYSLKAINAGYDAYGLYSQITIGNLADVSSAIKVLKEGVDKKYASACLAMADLHLDNNLEPDMLNPLECSRYLEMAFEYAKPSEKGTVAYVLSRKYKFLKGRFPYYKKDKSLYYLKIFNEYGSSFSPARFMNITLFNEGVENNDHGVVGLLFDRFNADSQVIFLLMLLEKHYKETGNTNVETGSIIYQLIMHLAKKEKNQVGKLLLSYIDNQSSEVMQNVFNKNRNSNYCIPNYYKESFDLFIDAYIDVMTENAQA